MTFSSNEMRVMPLGVWIEIFPQYFPAIFSHKNFSTRISHKNFPTRISHKIFPQDFPARFSHKNFPQDFPARFYRKIFQQDFPTRISCKIFPQEFPELDPDWLPPITLFQMLNFHQPLPFLNWFFPLLPVP